MNLPVGRIGQWKNAGGVAAHAFAFRRGGSCASLPPRAPASGGEGGRPQAGRVGGLSASSVLLIRSLRPRFDVPRRMTTGSLCCLQHAHPTPRIAALTRSHPPRASRTAPRGREKSERRCARDSPYRMMICRILASSVGLPGSGKSPSRSIAFRMAAIARRAASGLISLRKGRNPATSPTASGERTIIRSYAGTAGAIRPSNPSLRPMPSRLRAE
jgi:hypothetical protein